MAVERVKQLLAVQAPGMGFADSALLNAGSLLLKGINLVRRYRIYRNPDNAAALGVGHAIQFVAGNNPAVKDIARFVFLALSVLKCAEDLELLKNHFRELKGHVTGTTPVFVRKDPSFKKASWSKLGIRIEASLMWFTHVGVERVKRSFILIASIVKQLGILAFHLGDVQAAFTENHVSAVIVHSSALWKKLTDKESILAKKLTEMEKQNDVMLKLLNPSFTTAIFLKILTIPVKVQEVLPDAADVKEGVKKRLIKGKMLASAVLEEVLQIDHSLRKYQMGPIEMDPQRLKIVKPPVRIVAI